MKISLVPLTISDRDLASISRIHNQPSVEKYIKASENYFDYVTNSEGVIYYKVIADGIVTGGIHSETVKDTMYLSICIDEQYRRRNIAETALKQLFAQLLPCAVKTSDVSIDEKNTPSIVLFQKLGFKQIGKEDELNIYRLFLR